ncbi:HNH endonuclease [Nocardioides dongxiaopingii]|uniref:HNH endonuclease family protein n=1 Tax=Nocardioides sp. S-1144 TaxID=2582905 RepID=UPI00110E0275|nr:HNH endonuclease family protein [Nocardioides sp. S-1144]QCW51264.1 HNH endonuclease [Nocardioides sp. S-1144]
MRTLHRPSARVALAASLGSLLLGCSVPGLPVTDDADRAPRPAPAGGPAPSPTPGADRTRELLGLVRVVARRPDVPGYDRECGADGGCVFGTEWSDDTDAPDGHNGCDTRNDVLGASLRDVRYSERSPDCDVVAGTLDDPYTGARIDYATEGSQIHVDHLFPLAAAWDLGAAGWTPAQRARFANDTALELVAVDGTANLQKGDSTPASWLPPAKAYRCTYVTSYLEVAHAYDLAITDADVRVIEPVLRKSC